MTIYLLSVLLFFPILFSLSFLLFYITKKKQDILYFYSGADTGFKCGGARFISKQKHPDLGTHFFLRLFCTKFIPLSSIGAILKSQGGP